jgi:hypothetical protein
MFEGKAGLVLYVAFKLGGYTAWTYIGLASAWSGRRATVVGTLSRGIGRLVLGWATGLLVAPLAFVAVGTNHVKLFYFLALPFVRWLEWGLLQLSMSPSEPGATLVHGKDNTRRLWRLGGIIVSYLADAPFIIASGGFPQGRIFC